MKDIRNEGRSFRMGRIVVAACLSLTAIWMSQLSGCDNAAVEGRNEAAAQTEKAAAELEMIALTAVHPMSQAPREELRGKYRKFLADYGTAPAGALSEQKAHLSAMGAEARMSLSQLSLEEAGELETGVDQQMVLILQNLGSALELNAMAAASLKVDFSATKASLDSQAQRSLQRQNDLKKEAAEIQARIDDLEKEIQSELAQYESISNEAAARNDEAMSAPLDDRRAILEEAAAINRRANRHQVRAATLEAALDLVRPELANVEAKIEQTKTELESYRTSKNALTQRENVAAQNAAARKIDFEKMKSKITNQIDALYGSSNAASDGADGNDSFDAVVSAYDDAIEEAEKAVTLANAGRQSPGGEIRIVQAYQGLGTANWRKAQFLKSVSLTVARLAGEASLLGRGEVDRALDQKIQADIAGAMQAAGEAFTTATERADGLSSRDTDEKTKRMLVSGLNDAVKMLTGKEAVEETAVVDEGIDTTAGGGNETAARELTGDPRDTIRQILALDKNGEFVKEYDLLYADTDLEKSLLDQSRTLASSFESLNATCQDRLGTALFDADHNINSIFVSSLPNGNGSALGGSSDVGLPADEFMKLTDDDVNGLEFGYDGGKTTAWITNHTDLSQINFVMVDGRWKIDYNIPISVPVDQEQLMKDFYASFINEVGSGIGHVEDQVNNGSLTDIGAVHAAAGKVMSEAMQKVMRKAMEDAMKQMQQNQPSGGRGGPGGGGN